MRILDKITRRSKNLNGYLNFNYSTIIKAEFYNKNKNLKMLVQSINYNICETNRIVLPRSYVMASITDYQ